MRQRLRLGRDEMTPKVVLMLPVDMLVNVWEFGSGSSFWENTLE